MRISKDEYYINIAKAVSERSTCLRRHYGAVVVKNDEIISTGYNGSPRGELNCCDAGFCEREAQHVPHGERYELCKSVHAEMNAIISASRAELTGATLYLVGYDCNSEEWLENPQPCDMCARLIKNAGIKDIITEQVLLYAGPYGPSEKCRHFMHEHWSTNYILHGLQNSDK